MLKNVIKSWICFVECCFRADYAWRCVAWEITSIFPTVRLVYPTKKTYICVVFEKEIIILKIEAN